MVRGSGIFSNRETYIAAFAQDFKDPKSIRYHRIIDTIEISKAAPLAAEHGHWIGHASDGRPAYGGTYLAMWRKPTRVGKFARNSSSCSRAKIQPSAPNIKASLARQKRQNSDQFDNQGNEKTWLNPTLNPGCEELSPKSQLCIAEFFTRSSSPKKT